jgi:hypothetical protein
MSSKTLIPSLAIAPSNWWKSHVKPHVTLWSDDKTLPLEGSMGISFDVGEDLALLYATRGGRDAVKKHLMETVITHPESLGLGKAKPLSPFQADQVLDFYEWAQGEQPYFILRKGLKSLGLYKKTSQYSFNQPSKTTLPHRVSYKFIRPLQQGEPLDKGKVPPTLFWQELQLPTEPVASVEQSISEVMERLTRTREAVNTLVNDLDTALARFHRSLV